MISIQENKPRVREELLNLADKNSYIPPEVYEKYDVKRGLRNANGTGVVCGITNVASVDGYDIIDGKKLAVDGKLYYRGISLESIVDDLLEKKRFGFEETCFLLLFGELPSENDLRKFEKIMKEMRAFPKDFVQDVIIKIPSKNVMNKLQRATLVMYSYDDEADNTSLENTIIQSVSLLAKLPMMMAYAYQTMEHKYNNKSLVIHHPQDNMSTAENILRLIRDNGEFTDLEAKLLDLCLVIHADHGGGNNSAFATHVVSSTGTDFYSVMSTAMGSLKGPKHGGANHKVIGMTNDIMANCDYNNESILESYIRKILNKDAFDRKGLIYGMGHAVYTISDPRTVILKKKALELAKEKGKEEEFYLLNNIEKITKKIFKEERSQDICANVDMYSGYVYKILGISEELFTPIFALSRTSGWCAHRLEQIRDDKIIRPAYITNLKPRAFVGIQDRKDLI
ncbi:MAG: citrate synthase [Tissierellia bacterium]|nr:citrate synthase [Tissierellia bacterium]